MGVYIIGMEMPSIDLEWRIIHGQDGKWYAIDVNAETSDGEWHEIVPIPEHGRLIDADALYDEFVEAGQHSRRYKLGEKWELNWEEIRAVIERLEAIIPAEESE